MLREALMPAINGWVLAKCSVVKKEIFLLLNEYCRISNVNQLKNIPNLQGDFLFDI